MPEITDYNLEGESKNKKAATQAAKDEQVAGTPVQNQ